MFWFIVGLFVVGGVTCGLVDILKSITLEIRENHKELMNKVSDMKMTLDDHTVLLCEVSEIVDDFEE